jgi:RNA-directed DNA polymerase
VLGSVRPPPSIESTTTLVAQINKRIGDKRPLKLIRAFLNAGVMENGRVRPSVQRLHMGPALAPC